VSFVFNEHLKIVFLILILWSLVLFGVALTFLGAANIKSWFYGLFTIAQILNPLIPAVLVIGQSVSGNRLRQGGIFCVDLSRIVMSGKLSMFCFDKTGTLTKEGLEFHSIHGMSETSLQPELGEAVYEVDRAPMLMRLAMGCCHEVTEVMNSLFHST
jgi:cation-transporting ATPase 13A3/4/5